MKTFPKSLPSLREVQAEIKRRQKIKCETDHLAFTSYFFKARTGMDFRINWHHHLISEIIEDVIQGKKKNVVINVSPGSSKTETVVVNLIARGLALNPWCRFLHLSYADDLAMLNSSTAKDLVLSEEYQEFWPLQVAADAKAKHRWNVLLPNGKKAGGVYAVSLGGQVTGFRAGHMMEGFNGCILIDDPLKVEDAYSKTKRDAANRKLIATVKSRKANPDTPIVVIMQRLAEQDPTGFIKAGGLTGDWDFIEIPALMSPDYIDALPDHLKEMIDTSEHDEDGRVSYWPYKEPLKDLLELEKADKYVFTGQYQQRPSPIGGGLIKGAWFSRYTVAPKITYRVIFADTAQKTKEANDYSVFECWGKGEDGKIYLLDMRRGKWEAPDLRRTALEFWKKHLATKSPVIGPLRALKVEDKSSGTGLIQDLKRGPESIPVRGVERNTDKLTRVMDVVSYIEAGLVCIPEDQPWVSDFIAECESFTADDSHAHDDQIDPMCDAITDMLAAKPKGILDVL